MTPVVAYYRTSSAANVGEDKDSQRRQREAVYGYASRQDMDVVAEFYDAAVKGGDPVDVRPGFAEMMAYMSEHHVTIILVEQASRFARDLIVQETGYHMLRRQGRTLIAVDDPDAFTADTPTATLIRQILGAVSQFEKANLVAKLAGARQRKRIATGRCEGPKPAPEPARQMAQALRSTGKSLREIAAALAEAGYYAPSGGVYFPQSVKRMLGTETADAAL